MPCGCLTTPPPVVVYLVPLSILLVLVGVCGPVPVCWLLPTLNICPEHRRMSLRVVTWLGHWLSNRLGHRLLVWVRSNVAVCVVSRNWNLIYEVVWVVSRVSGLGLVGLLDRFCLRFR